MVLSFFRGHPSDSLLPNEAILEATRVILTSKDPEFEDPRNRHPLTYGTDEGAYWVRKELAEWTNRTIGGTATAECINLTNGASFGAASALSQCAPRNYTRQAFIASPTYHLINRIFDDAGLGEQDDCGSKTIAIVETEEGLDLNSLEAWLEDDSSEALRILADEPRLPLFSYVFYLLPSFSNPSGRTLSQEQREKLLSIARKYNMLILCDEVYNWLDFHGTQRNIKTLVTLDRESLPEGSVGNVIANFSMSKIMGPGLRVGWQEAASEALAHHLSQSGAIISGGTPSQLNTYIVGELIRSGAIDTTLAKLNKVYNERAMAYTSTIKKHFPAGTEISGGDGGYFLWLTLPLGYDIPGIVAECKQNGILLASGDNFEVTGAIIGWGERCFRVSFSYIPTEEALPALEKWAEVVKKYAPSVQQDGSWQPHDKSQPAPPYSAYKMV